MWGKGKLCYHQVMVGREINLLPSAQWSYSLPAFLLKWVVSYGRYVLVITELIVILAFLSRFKLDQDLMDLEDKIATNKTILESSVKFEEKIKQITEKQNFILSEWKKQPLWSVYLNTLTRLLPKGVTLVSIEVDKEKMNLTGSSVNETELAYFINNLKTSKAFKKIRVEKVSSDLSMQGVRLISFSITAYLNPVYVKY